MKTRKKIEGPLKNKKKEHLMQTRMCISPRREYTTCEEGVGKAKGGGGKRILMILV